MSRIENALAKLQARQQTNMRDSGLQQMLATTHGETVQKEMRASAVDHQYGGRRVEIDVAELHAQKLSVSGSKRRRLADEYRSIKRPLLRNASVGQGPSVPRGNLWMVTSALSGEGKTFTCINLCLSAAREKDWSVVLVDGDSIKPHLTKLFGAEGQPGFLDLLRDSTMAFDSIVMPTDIPGLSLLPAGQSDDHAAELLASGRMDALCNELVSGDPHRIVLFDSPPLLLTAEAPVLASQVGQIVLVVHANRTSQRAVLEARDRLDPSKAINLLLNHAPARESTLAHGEYHGYGFEE